MPQLCEGLVACNRKEPGGEARARREALGLLPDAQECLAGHVLGEGFIADETQHEAIDPGMVAREQGLHGKPVAGRNLGDERLVGILTLRLSRRPGETDWCVAGKMMTHEAPPSFLLTVDCH